MRPRRALRADRRRAPLRRADGGVARAVERRRPGGDRPFLAGPRRRLRVPPRLPRQCARSGLRLRALGAPAHRGKCPGGVRARRRRPGPPGAARPPVLALLSVQRLQQPARGRLGDDPARLRRSRCGRGARRGARVGRVQLARGRRERELGRRQARDRRRHASRRLPRRRLARQQVHGSPLPGKLRRAGRRVRRHPGPSHRAPSSGDDDPERPLSGALGVSVDRVRGSLGRAAGGVFQRPDRA